MTSRALVSTGLLLAVAAHVSEIVCLEPGSTLRLPSPQRQRARRRARATTVHTPTSRDYAHPDTVESGL
jgi:hypothetical protein